MSPPPFLSALNLTPMWCWTLDNNILRYLMIIQMNKDDEQYDCLTQNKERVSIWHLLLNHKEPQAVEMLVERRRPIILNNYCTWAEFSFSFSIYHLVSRFFTWSSCMLKYDRGRVQTDSEYNYATHIPTYLKPQNVKPQGITQACMKFKIQHRTPQSCVWRNWEILRCTVYYLHIT